MGFSPWRYSRGIGDYKAFKLYPVCPNSADLPYCLSCGLVWRVSPSVPPSLPDRLSRCVITTLRLWRDNTAIYTN